jgi:TRAP-type mannitol/chloroaromatic compound transport system permease small subunit
MAEPVGKGTNASRAVVRFIDATNERIGRAVSWLTLFMVLIQMAVVVLRYVFGVGWVALQESIVYMHGAVFLIAAGYTLLHDSHVRIDIFYRSASDRGKASVNLLGAVFLLLPMTCAVFWITWPYATRSWAVFETSPEGSGIPAVFLLKSVILVYAVLLAMQGIALALRSAMILAAAPPPPPPPNGGLAEPM